MNALPLLTLALLGPGSSAPAPSPPGTLTSLRGGSAWVPTNLCQPARQLPHFRGAVLLDIPPASGSAAFMCGPEGWCVHTDQAPALTPWLSEAPSTTPAPFAPAGGSGRVTGGT